MALRRVRTLFRSCWPTFRSNFTTFHSPTGLLSVWGFFLFPRTSCQHALSRAWPAWDTGWLKRDPLAITRGAVSRQSATLRPFFSSLWPSGALSKCHDFFPSVKMANKSTKTGNESTKSWFWNQITRLFGTILHHFLNLFLKRENLKIDDPYNTLACFCFRKHSICHSSFQKIPCFFRLATKINSLTLLATFYTQKIYLLLDFGTSKGPQSDHLGDILTQIAPKNSDRFVPDASRSRPSSHSVLKSDQNSFLIDLGSYFHRFWSIFNVFPYTFRVSSSILRTFLCFFHARYPPSETLCSLLQLCTNCAANTIAKLSF